MDIKNEKTDFRDTKCPHCGMQILRVWKDTEIKCPWCGKKFIVKSIIPLDYPDKLYRQRFMEIKN